MVPRAWSAIISTETWEDVQPETLLVSASESEGSRKVKFFLLKFIKRCERYRIIYEWRDFWKFLPLVPKS